MSETCLHSAWSSNLNDNHFGTKLGNLTPWTKSSGCEQAIWFQDLDWNTVTLVKKLGRLFYLGQ